MKIKFRLVDWKLKHKVVFHIFVIGLMAVSALFVLFIRSEKDLITAFTREKTEMVGALIDCNIRHQITSEGAESVYIDLERMIRASSLERLRLLNLNGEILNSSDKNEVGTMVPDSEKSLLQQLFSETDRADFFDSKPLSRTQSYVPVENRGECACCHGTEVRFIGILEVKFDESLESDLMHRSITQGIIIALSTLFILTFVTYRLYGRVINRPLVRFKENMNRVQNGELGLRMEANRKDEFGELASSFNVMVQNLQQANQEIEELHTRQMERAGHLASLGELAAGLAHEIKNPVAGIKGAVEIISEQSGADDPRREIFEEVLKQTDRIHTNIQDLLHYAPPRGLSRYRESPNACIQDAIHMAEPQTGDKDIRFQFSPLDKEVTAYLDRDKIQEVVLNLLLNGIAAIEKKGEISIVLDHDASEISIRIKDTGKGISPEQLPLIFNPFFTTRKQGTGLGLSLCLQIIQAHKGAIEAKSEVGRGTVFIIRLPITHQKEIL